MRYPFTDGWNSFWHLAFGALSVVIPYISPLFLLYQFVLFYDPNSVIDTLEYGIGILSVPFPLIVNLLPLFQYLVTHPSEEKPDSPSASESSPIQCTGSSPSE